MIGKLLPRSIVCSTHTSATSLPIILETRNLVVISKPHNVPFHNDEHGLGVCNRLRRQLAAERGSNDDDISLFPVHRLDTITSGCLMFAKNIDTAREMTANFSSKEGTVVKYYVALSRRKPSKTSGAVIGDMVRSRRGTWKLQRTTTNPAITRFVTTSMLDEEKRRIARAFLLRPITGKTHQLRVAMKSLGSPIAGDVRYADANEAKKEDRAYLHCAALRTRVQGELIQVVCPPTTGIDFLRPRFREIFDEWFPKEMASTEAEWFCDSKLLRSSMLE